MRVTCRYMSLHWRLRDLAAADVGAAADVTGGMAAKLRAAAADEGITRDEKFRRLIYEAIHDYMAVEVCNRIIYRNDTVAACVLHC